MATKNNPGQFDCYANADPDEPMFVLLGRDKHAPSLIWLWAVLRELDQEKPEKIKEARECAVEMIQWAHDHGRKSVGIGQSVLAGVLELIRAANAAAPESLNSKSDVDTVRALLTATVFETPAAEWTTEELLKKAIDDGGYDICPCMSCGKAVVCIPDGLAMCKHCAEKQDD